MSIWTNKDKNKELFRYMVQR